MFTYLVYSVDVKLHLEKFIQSSQELCESRCVKELCESRCGRPGRPVPNSPYGLCGRKATLNLN